MDGLHMLGVEGASATGITEAQAWDQMAKGPVDARAVGYSRNGQPYILVRVIADDGKSTVWNGPVRDLDRWKLWALLAGVAVLGVGAVAIVTLAVKTKWLVAALGLLITPAAAIGAYAATRTLTRVKVAGKKIG